jgi:hypothetical protein
MEILNCPLPQIKAAEDEISLGQLEEVADHARDELELIDYYFGTLMMSFIGLKDLFCILSYNFLWF